MSATGLPGDGACHFPGGGEDALAGPADAFGLAPPPGHQLLEGDAGLVPAGVGGGFPGDGRVLPLGRVAAFAFAEAEQHHLAEVFDLPGPLREHLEDLGGDAGDLGLAVDHGSPGDAVAGGELGAQDRLVDEAQGPLVVLQIRRIQRIPAAIGQLHLGGGDPVGVQLGVVLPGRGLGEERHRQPDGVRIGPGPVHPDTGGGPEPLDMIHHRLHGQIMGLPPAVVAGERPQHRHRLRGGEGAVEAGHRLDQLAVLGHPIHEPGTEQPTGVRVVAGEDRLRGPRSTPPRTSRAGRRPGRPTRPVVRRCRPGSGTGCSRRPTCPPSDA